MKLNHSLSVIMAVAGKLRGGCQIRIRYVAVSKLE
jgi:hypothetical protein